MRFFTRFALKNPVAIWIIAILLILGGIFSATQLQEELMPSISIPVLAVITTYPGASPEAVAKDVTDPLEKALRGVQNVSDVISSSVQNVSEIQLQLSMSASTNKVAQDVQNTINQVVLPSTATKPSVQQFSFSSSPILYFTVSSQSATPAELRTTVNNTIVPALQGISGVANVQTDGAAPEQVQIIFHPSALQKHNLTEATVLQYLQADNVSMPVGTATIDQKQYPAHLSGQFTTLASIKNIPIPITPSPTAGISSGFSQIGKAIGALGSGEGQLGQAVGGLGKAVGGIGKAVGGLGQAVSALGQSQGQLAQGLGLVMAENQILTNMQSLQGQIYGATLSLTQQMMLPKAQQDPAKIAQLSAMITQLQMADQGLAAELKAIAPKSAGTSAQHGQGAGTNAASSLSALSALSKLGSASTPSGSLPQSSGNPSLTTGSSLSSSTKASSTMATVPLSAVATVQIAPPTDASINRTNGQTSVLISVVKTENSNTVSLAATVQSKMNSLASSLPYGLHVTTLYDASGMIKASISGLIREAILGAIFAALVILLFLRNLKTTLIAVISIPISLLTAIILLNVFGVTLNIMTLGGMAVATGRVVDDSIVVIENIFRSWRKGYGFGKKFVLKATGEVGQAITSSTITTIAVFLPLGLVSGVVGKIFFPFALTVIVSLLSSLLVALTVVPLLAWLFVAKKQTKDGDYAWLTGTAEDHPNGAFAEGILLQDTESHESLRPWQIGYRRFLNWALNHKITVIGITLVALIASIAVLPLAGSTFLPSSSDKFATVSISMPTGTTLSATNQKTLQVENLLKQYPSQIQIINSQIGSDPGQSQGFSVLGSNSASLFLKLNSNVHVTAFTNMLGDKVKAIAGNANIQVQGMSTTGTAANFDLIVSGADPAKVKQAALQITNALKGFSGMNDLQNNLNQTEPEIKIVPNDLTAAQYGLTPYALSSDVRNYLATNDIGAITLNNQSYDMVTSIQLPNGISKLNDIKNLSISTPTGQSVSLQKVASVTIAQTPISILHRDGSSYAEITANYTTSNTGLVTANALKKVASLTLPNGVTTSISGSSQQQNQSFSQLIEAVFVAIGMVYIVMLIAFSEWVAPFAILFSMPVALIGAFFGTVVGHQPVSVSSLIGILMLMGIVVTNAIVLVDRVEQQRKAGLTIREALLEAGTTRLRPILMTAIATIFALAPLALGFSEGALISQGLAVIVVGGLITSTLLTLIIVPIIFEILHTRTRKREKAGLNVLHHHQW